MRTALTYQEIRPGDALKDYIYSYWVFSYLPDSSQEILQHSVPPDGCLSLAFPYHPAAPRLGPSLLGPQTGIFRLPVYPGSYCLGVRFLPGVGKAVFGTSPKEWVDQNLEAEPWVKGLDVEAVFRQWPEKEVAAEWLDPILLSWKAPQTIALDEPILQATRFILAADGNVKVARVAQEVFMSERQFQRRFQEAVGLSPKVFCRIRRMRAALLERLLAEKPYADILFDHGYTDKSHFNRDFAAIAGLSSAELEQYLKQIEHLGLEE